MWVTMSAIFGRGQRAFVLERRDACCLQSRQVVGHLGPHGERPADIGAGEEEFGGELGLEPWRRVGAIAHT